MNTRTRDMVVAGMVRFAVGLAVYLALGAGAMLAHRWGLR